MKPLLEGPFITCGRPHRRALNKLRQRSGRTPLDQIVKIRLPVFGFGLQQDLIYLQYTSTPA